MQQTFEQSPNDLASQRLRKAIERNRAKQMKRTQVSRSGASRQEDLFSSSTSSRLRSNRANWSPPRTSSKSSSRSTSVRTGVARPDEETEFSSDIKSKRSRVARPSKANYLPVTTPRKTTASRKRASTKKDDRQFISYLTIGAWIFCGIILLRLIFASGGVVDFYASHSRLEERRAEFDRLVNENQELEVEIELIQFDRGYQRQLVRDHLGYIANDEYLIIFPNRSEPSSI